MQLLKGQPKIQGTVNRDTYHTIHKQFSVVDQTGLPDKRSS